MVDPTTNEEIEIKERLLILSIAQTYKEHMDEEGVLEVASQAWKVDKDRKDKADYALAVYHDEVKGVFEILGWYKDILEPGRWAFEGRIAPKHIRDKYLGMKESAWSQGLQIPFIYINC